MKVILVTGNIAKLINTRNKLKPFNIEVEQIKMDTIEIQADTIEEIAAYSAKYAADKLKCGVIKIDSGLFVEALKGFPGPYTHYVEDTINNEYFLKLLKDEKNRKAEFREAVAYCEPDKEPVVFTSVTKGTIAEKESGTYGWSWDFLFIPEGQEVTLGHFDDYDRFNLWDDKAYIEMGEYLKKHFDK